MPPDHELALNALSVCLKRQSYVTGSRPGPWGFEESRFPDICDSTAAWYGLELIAGVLTIRRILIHGNSIVLKVIR